MNINYCKHSCEVGKKACDYFLEINESVFEAAIDFRFFVTKCFETCPYKDMQKIEVREDCE